LSIGFGRRRLVGNCRPRQFSGKMDVLVTRVPPQARVGGRACGRTQHRASGYMCGLGEARPPAPQVIPGMWEPSEKEGSVHASFRTILRKGTNDADRRERAMYGRRYVVALVLVGGFVGGAAIESQGAPVLTNTVAIRSAAPNLDTEVRRGHHWRWGYGSRSSVCWDRGRRVVCPGYPPGN